MGGTGGERRDTDRQALLGHDRQVLGRRCEHVDQVLRTGSASSPEPVSAKPAALVPRHAARPDVSSRTFDAQQPAVSFELQPHRRQGIESVVLDGHMLDTVDEDGHGVARPPARAGRFSVHGDRGRRRLAPAVGSALVRGHPGGIPMSVLAGDGRPNTG